LFFDNEYNGIRKIEYNDSCSSAAEELIKAGADLAAVNNEGKTPMKKTDKTKARTVPSKTCLKVIFKKTKLF
jgi:hypothetical protein